MQRELDVAPKRLEKGDTAFVPTPIGGKRQGTETRERSLTRLG